MNSKWSEVAPGLRTRLLKWVIEEADNSYQLRNGFDEYEFPEDIAVIKAALVAMVASLMMHDQPKGCSTCPYATRRFNNGQGATTCVLLNQRTVAYGHDVPETKPDVCPLKEDSVTYRENI